MANTKHVLLTGAFGNVGAQTLRALIAKGYRVTAFDIHSPANDKVQADLAKEIEFDTEWGDLRAAPALESMVSRVHPDAVVHVAAVIAPIAYVVPELAHAVNVDGTRNLIQAAEALGTGPRFIFTSSYSVHGPRNPHSKLPPLTGDTPVNPSDNYGCHKVESEKMLRASSLPWTILRLGAVAPVAGMQRVPPEVTKFTFMLPPEHNASGVDVRDVATALTNAVEADCIGRTFIIAGDPSWQGPFGDFLRRTFEANGLPMPPLEAFRMADPEVDESWYFQDFVDTVEPQKVLGYQNHTVDQYIDHVRATGVRRLVMKAMGPLVKRQLLKASPYYGKPRQPDPTPMKQVIIEEFGLDPAEAECEPI